jgi:hypothetical protein
MMINTSHNVQIDGNAIDHDELMRTFTLDTNDRYSRWVLKPLAVLSALGFAVASMIAGAVLLALSVALLPMLALGAWALKSELQRDATAVYRRRSARVAHTDCRPFTSD